MEIIEGIKETLGESLGEDIDISTVGPETDLREDLGFNSIGLLAMAVSLEEKFDFRFSNEDFVKIRTVGDVIDVISRK
jgi:acyl carrier protein